MELLLQRDTYTSNSIFGVLNNSDLWTVQTLELPKVDGLPGSAIPAGRYRITIAFSPHFNRPMPLIVGIPNRSEIEIHWGNTHTDTRGCILVGMAREGDSIIQSKEAFANIFSYIEDADHMEGCWITVKDA